eukprot:CAMPEP_0182566312 /NCGR_PEP_ID=MMETSP1324-20130603/7809_1 /TAXON_ID=236786 /ORGANISM="Florenciella sp., Strain RCC1587" /LENGTH=245 /DNA_ID=CAMNT_0024780089 /DNA_START=12 /DNA_END=749 /DNA_ORIENTATION=-
MNHVYRPKYVPIDPDEDEVMNTTSEVTMVGLWDSRERTGYEAQEWPMPIISMFVEDAMEDVSRIGDKAQMLMERNTAMANPISLKEIIENFDTEYEIGSTAEPKRFPTEFTSVDRLINNEMSVEDQEKENVKLAFLAVVNSDLPKLEELLDDLHVPLESTDVNGCSLFVCAVQQGDKHIAKYLLRKNANANHQTLTGCTALHYAFEYGHKDLGDYLISKGANPNLLNAEGCTCYEGLRRDEVDQW